MIFTFIATSMPYVSSLYILNSVLYFYNIKDQYTIGGIILLSFISYVPFKIYQFFEIMFNAEFVDKLKYIDKKNN